MTTFEELRAYCLGKPGVSEELPFDLVTPVWKVGGRMFALSGLRSDPPRVNLKGDPNDNEVLRAAHPAILPGWHMNKRHWNTVVLDGSLPDGLVREMVDRSYELVKAKLPRKVREELAG